MQLAALHAFQEIFHFRPNPHDPHRQKARGTDAVGLAIVERKEEERVT